MNRRRSRRGSEFDAAGPRPTRPAPADECAMPAETRTRFHQPAVRAETGARVSGTHVSSEPHVQHERGQQQASETEHEKGCERAGGATSQPKFWPKNPVMNVRGRNTVAINVSCSMLSFSANARLGLLSRDHGQGCLEDRCQEIPCAATSSSTSRRWSWTSRRYGTSALSTSTTIPARACRAAPAADGRPDRSRQPAQ